MGKGTNKTLLFLCTGNYYRSRFAEIIFNNTARKFGMSWTATSKGLALERGVNNVGPMAAEAIDAVKAQGICAAEECTRFPMQVANDDLELAEMIIALKKAEHLPLVQERFPTWTEKIEFWHIDDAPNVLPLIEQEVMGLVARLLGGSKQREVPPFVSDERDLQPYTSQKKPTTLRVGRETKGRRGQGVTTVSDIPLDEKGIRELATNLKQKCGTGGTVKNGRIEIQGNQRDRIMAILEKMGYKAKRTGG